MYSDLHWVSMNLSSLTYALVGYEYWKEPRLTQSFISVRDELRVDVTRVIFVKPQSDILENNGYEYY